jgi:hypothetical protein
MSRPEILDMVVGFQDDSAGDRVASAVGTRCTQMSLRSRTLGGLMLIISRRFHVRAPLWARRSTAPGLPYFDEACLIPRLDQSINPGRAAPRLYPYDLHTITIDYRVSTDDGDSRSLEDPGEGDAGLHPRAMPHGVPAGGVSGAACCRRATSASQSATWGRFGACSRAC